jgi:hypothetical protein
MDYSSASLQGLHDNVSTVFRSSLTTYGAVAQTHTSLEHPINTGGFE